MTMISNSMRRVFSSCRQLSVIYCSLHSRTHYFPLTSSSFPINSNPITPSISTTFLFQPTKGFAGRCYYQTYTDNDNGDDESGVTYGTVDFGNAVKSVARSQMEAAVEAMPRVLDKLPTSAIVGMRQLVHLKVLINGSKIPFKKMADVSIIDAGSLSITPYEPKNKRILVKAITELKYEIHPEKDGKFTAYMPLFTEGYRQKIIRSAKKSSEHVKQSIRRVRHKALETIKKSIPKRKEKEKMSLSISGFTDRDAKKLEKEVDEMTRKYIKSIEDICKLKAKEIARVYW